MAWGTLPLNVTTEGLLLWLSTKLPRRTKWRTRRRFTWRMSKRERN